VPDGAGMIIVLAWPVTVVTLVMASVAVLGDGAGVGEGLELGIGDVTSVLDCACEVVELVVADEAETVTAEEVSAVDELA